MHRDVNLCGRPRNRKGARHAIFAPIVLILAFPMIGCHEFQIAWVAQAVLRQAQSEVTLAALDISGPSKPRVLLYEWELRPGHKVTSADLSEWEIDGPLICRNRCWLFFVDFMPKAHFAHPTAIALYDLDENSIDLRLANWWPTVAGPLDVRTTSVFSTFDQRDSEDHQVLPFPKSGMFPLQPDVMPGLVPRRIYFVSFLDSTPIPEDPDPEARSATWALLVQGYSDLTDTFVDDVSRSAKVMDGLRVPSSNVKVVKPLAPSYSGASCYMSLNLAVKDLLSEMKDKKCEEFILYFSSHGDSSGKLHCSYDIYDPIQYWEGSEISSTLREFGPGSNPSVVCEKVTVVFQSCYAGSLVNAVNTGLAGVPHAVVTSSDAAKVSFIDIDDDIAEGLDDSNEGDVGTEFSSGFWEAYGRETADGSDESIKDLDVDLVEAFYYAKEHDVTHTKYTTNPEIVPSPAIGFATNTLLKTQEDLALDDHAELKITGVSIDNLSGVAGSIVIDDTNTFSVDVENTSNHYAPVLTVRIILKGGGGIEREIGRTEIIAGLEANEGVSSKVQWKLKGSFPVGDFDDICLVADSPSLGTGNAAEYCLGSFPVVPNPTPTPTPSYCLLGCTH